MVRISEVLLYFSVYPLIAEHPDYEDFSVYRVGASLLEIYISYYIDTEKYHESVTVY